MKLITILILMSLPVISGAEENKIVTSIMVEKDYQQKKIERMMQDWKVRYDSFLKQNPPLPPWLKFPDYDRYSVGWRMGKGEDYMTNDIGPYFHFASQEEIDNYRLKYPAPEGWEGWYDE